MLDFENSPYREVLIGKSTIWTNRGPSRSALARWIWRTGIALEKILLSSYCSFGLMRDVAKMLPTIGLTAGGQPKKKVERKFRWRWRGQQSSLHFFCNSLTDSFTCLESGAPCISGRVRMLLPRNKLTKAIN